MQIFGSLCHDSFKWSDVDSFVKNASNSSEDEDEDCDEDLLENREKWEYYHCHQHCQLNTKVFLNCFWFYHLLIILCPDSFNIITTRSDPLSTFIQSSRKMFLLQYALEVIFSVLHKLKCVPRWRWVRRTDSRQLSERRRRELGRRRRISNLQNKLLTTFFKKMTEKRWRRRKRFPFNIR